MVRSEARWAALPPRQLLTTISPSSAAVEVHLTAAGDYGARPTTGAVLDKIAEINPDAHLALGDLAYGDSLDEYAWCGFVKQHVGEGFHSSSSWAITRAWTGPPTARSTISAPVSRTRFQVPSAPMAASTTWTSRKAPHWCG